jgi:carbamoyl-phosphate synthase large subunit
MTPPAQRVIVAGAAGASLGTEVLKALALSDRYDAVAADVAPLAYGLYQQGIAGSHVLRASSYIDDLIAVCEKEGATLVLPGAEPTLKLMAANHERLRAAGIHPVLNRPEVIAACSDKSATSAVLASKGIPVPRTAVLRSEADLDECPLPCIIKPATDTGASALVSPASTRDEALLYSQWIWNAGLVAVAQEYLPHREGEFTIGVLRFPGFLGSIAMKREFPCKLSYVLRTEQFLVSSGYSQGLIDAFPDLCKQAETIAEALDSYGPINIQARVIDGVLYPFEINPRFSGTTYLRAMAGFNEIEIFLDHLNGRPVPPVPAIRPGYYMRSFAEQYVPVDAIKHPE